MAIDWPEERVISVFLFAMTYGRSPRKCRGRRGRRGRRAARSTGLKSLSFIGDKHYSNCSYTITTFCVFLNSFCHVRVIE